MAKKTSLKVKNKRSHSKSFKKNSSKQKPTFKNDKNKKNFMLSKHNPLKDKKKKSVKPTNDILAKNIFNIQNKKIVDELYSSKVDPENNPEDWDMLEEDYENELPEDSTEPKYLLPIKTKTGIVPVIKKTEDEIEESEQDQDEGSDKENSEDETDEETPDTAKLPTMITAAQLLATQSKTVEEKKIQIGSLSASILENPEEKIENLRALVNMLQADEIGHSLIIKKMVIISLVEVFKDLLPSYNFKEDIDTTIKLKKETMKLNKYETTILQFYKKFLLFLSKFSSVLIKRRDGIVKSSIKLRLGEIALNALCDLLQSHPYFNYAENIAQVVIPFLNHTDSVIREKVKIVCNNVFNEDLKLDITLKILRLINHNLKKFSYNIHTDMLEVLLFLKIKDVNMDQERIQKLKQKKLQSHKGNILKLSRNEKKRSARLKEVERTLMQAKAEENRQNKQKHMTEITKLTFGIYFKVLKNSTNTKIVGVCLQGVAKFAYCLSVEFYTDLINILENLLNADWMAHIEKQRCLQTIFAILCQQGEVLNYDPASFYSVIYENLLTIHAGRNYEDFKVVVETLIYSLVKRQKRITQKRAASFLKKILTLSLQLLHNGTLSCMVISKSLLQSNSAMDILLDLESSWGDGVYQPELRDPEYCNAASSALYELALLNRHYHPSVSEYSKHIAQGASASSEHLPNILTRTSADEVFNMFDMSQMCFYPPIPIVKKSVSTKNKFNRNYRDIQFITDCKKIVKNSNCGLLCIN